MAFLNFRRNPDNALESGGRKVSQTAAEKNEITCPNCHRSVEADKLAATLSCCPHCGHHFSVSARERINMICDRNSFVELFGDIVSKDPLQFHEYGQKLAKAQQASGENEAVICGTASIGGAKCAFFVMEGKFMMGSMGAAVGERITRLLNMRSKNGCRCRLYRFRRCAHVRRGCFPSCRWRKSAVLSTNTARLACSICRSSLGRRRAASQPALPWKAISFSLSLVRTSVCRCACHRADDAQKPAERFPRSAEFLLEHGFVDAIVPRAKQRVTLSRLLKLHGERSGQ